MTSERERLQPYTGIALNSSRARSIAEQNWQRGGTNALKTNRKGAYYYSCSAHGGYVVDGNALTTEEKTNIEKHIKPEIGCVAVDNTTGKIKHFSYWGSFRYNIGSQTLYKTLIYLFEEDCAWSVLEKYTDIRTPLSECLMPSDDGYIPSTQEYHDGTIINTFNRWYNKATA